MVSVTSSREKRRAWLHSTSYNNPASLPRGNRWCFLSRPNRQSRPVSTGEPTPSRSFYVTLKFKLFCSLRGKKNEEATTHRLNRPPSWSHVQQRSQAHWSLLERGLGTGPRGTGADLAANNERVKKGKWIKGISCVQCTICWDSLIGFTRAQIHLHGEL